MADQKITALTELAATPETTDILPIVDDPGGSATTKKITVANLMAAGGGSSTEVVALVASQINVSSIGDTYTDVAGNTYAETTHQTRLTYASSIRRNLVVSISGHVNSGTGTFQKYNFTDSSSLATATTTSVTEVVVDPNGSYTAAATDIGDAITIRVKNSGAGGTVTIDQGGIFESDGMIGSNVITSTGQKNFNNINVNGYPVNMSILVLKISTGATITAQLRYEHDAAGATGQLFTNIGNTFGTADANTVITRTGTLKQVVSVTGWLGANISAISGTYSIGLSYQLKLDNI